MSKKQISSKQAVLFRFIPPAWRQRCQRLSIGIAIFGTLYALAGFTLAPYLLGKYLPQYAEKQLHATLKIGTIRVNPLFFTCELKKVSLQQEGEDEPLFAVDRLYLDFEADSLFRQAWTFADLVIENPVIRLKIDKDGTLNLARLNPSGTAEPAASQSPSQPIPLPRLLLKHFYLYGGSASLTDHSRKPKPQTFTLNPLTIALTKISTLPEQHGNYAVTATLPEGGSIAWKGELSLAPLLATGAFEIKDFKPATIWGFLPDRVHIAAPPGALHLTASYRFAYQNATPALELNPLNIELQGLSIKGTNAAQPILKLDRLIASGGRIDLPKHQVIFPTIALHGLQATASMDANGRGNWQELVDPEEDQEPTPPWQIGIDSLSLVDSTVLFSNASPASPMNLSLGLDKLSLASAKVDLAKQEASGKRLALSGGSLTLNQGQTISNPPTKAMTAAPATQGHAAQEHPWKTTLNQFKLEGFRLGFTDQATKLAYALTGLTAEAKDIGSSSQPIAFSLATAIEQGGEATISGTASQSGDRIEAQAQISRLNLKPLDTLLGQHAALTLVSGDFSAKAHLLRTPGNQEQATLAIDGDASINNLLLNENDTGDRLLAWKAATANGVALNLNPDRLNIQEVRLQGPGAKIIIFKDKSLNLTKLGKQEATPPSKKAPDSEDKPFPVAVERVRLENGVVDFADFSLILPFSTRIEQCKGSVIGISTQPNSHASLRFEGRVGEFGQALAEGSLTPANPKQFTDIKVGFHNVAMAPLSPYTVTFAGRTIASGKLNLDLDYDIRNSELLGKNTVMLEDFTLGDRVESPSAMNLPLDLAISLLTDSEGKIDIAVPIRGNIDHPEFSYGQVVREALSNLLGKIVTSPFRALAALFGGHSENLDAILFEPGRAELAPPEQEKLKKITALLSKRKQLQLTVHGGFEPSLDGPALNSAQVRRSLAQKFWGKLDANEDPGPVAFDNAKTQHALENLAGNKLAAFQTSYEELSGRKVKRVNPALALVGQASEDRDFYQALFEYLVKTAPLPQAELQKLAEQRGKAIAQELTGQAGADAGQIAVGTVVQTEEHEQAVPAKLELTVR